MESVTTVRTFALIAATVWLAACEYSPNMSDRTIAYNQAVAQSTNDLFLLNALRAAARQPTYYSRNQANSATAAVTPSLSSTLPVGNGITRSISPALRVTQTIAKTALTLTPSLSATESNQLTLSNLDDQPSMNGLLTPVTLQQISNYLQEGFSPEELDLLYIGSLSISEPILKTLPNAVAETCATKADLGGAGFGTQNTYCRYFFGSGRHGLKLYPSKRNSKIICTGVVTGRLEKVCPKFTRDALLPGRSFNTVCFDGGSIADEDPQDAIGATGVPAEPRTFAFLNDPAIDGVPTNFTPHDRKYFTCFRQVLLALLALDFGPTDTPSKFLYRLSLGDTRANPRFFADLTQQKLQIGIDGRKVTVCKPADDLTLAYAKDAYVKTIFQQTDTSMMEGRTNESGEIEAGTQLSSAPAAAQEQPAAPVKLQDHARAEPRDEKESACGEAGDAARKRGPKSKAPHVAYTPRSLEAIVYYLGQIIRRYQAQADATRRPVTFYNAANVDQPYEEDLFDVRKGAPPSDAIAAADQPDGTYYVPGLCLNEGPARYKDGCIAEYPDHASAQVLTMLNQLWGLNKTQAAAPVIPTVTVINP